MMHGAVRRIAAAARNNDLAGVQAILAEMAACGDARVIDGRRDADRASGRLKPLDPLPSANPVTIHDLPEGASFSVEKSNFGPYSVLHRLVTKAA